MLTRRGLIGSLISLAAAPAIVRASSLMPVKVMEDYAFEWSPYYTQYRLDDIGPLYDLLQKRVNLAYNIMQVQLVQHLYGDNRHNEPNSFGDLFDGRE